MNEATAMALRAERAVAGLTVRQLSHRSGVPLSSLTRVLSSQRGIKVNQVATLAATLDVTCQGLVRGAEELTTRADG